MSHPTTAEKPAVSQKQHDQSSTTTSPQQQQKTPERRGGDNPNNQQPQRQSSQSGGKNGHKVNQAAFIHKLYSMLEDASISHLISWTPTNDSFVICPGEEFSKVLSQYFKHTNVSSFVRQLNMYGFHKVNDTFHGNSGSNNSTGQSSDSTQWEFKHGGGSFKRGDVEALRAIKRRASRQTVVQRESFVKSVSIAVPPNAPGPNDYSSSAAAAAAAAAAAQAAENPPPHPAVSVEPPIASNMDARLGNLEQTVWYLQDANYRLQTKNTTLTDVLRNTQGDITKVLELMSKYMADKTRRSRDDVEDAYYNELERLKGDLQYRMSSWGQDEHRFSAPPTYSLPTFQQPKTERAASVFYDPLAPAPAQQQASSASSSLASTPAAHESKSLSSSSLAVTAATNAAYRQHESTPSSPAPPEALFHQPFQHHVSSSPYPPPPPPGAHEGPLLRDQRSGSYPLAYQPPYHHHHHLQQHPTAAGLHHQMHPHHHAAATAPQRGQSYSGPFVKTTSNLKPELPQFRRHTSGGEYTGFQGPPPPPPPPAHAAAAAGLLPPQASSPQVSAPTAAGAAGGAGAATAPMPPSALGTANVISSSSTSSSPSVTTNGVNNNNNNNNNNSTSSNSSNGLTSPARHRPTSTSNASTTTTTNTLTNPQPSHHSIASKLPGPTPLPSISSNGAFQKPSSIVDSRHNSASSVSSSVNNSAVTSPHKGLPPPHLTGAHHQQQQQRSGSVQSLLNPDPQQPSDDAERAAKRLRLSN